VVASTSQPLPPSGNSGCSLLAADYSLGRWRVLGSISPGSQSLDVGNMPCSPNGNLWIAMLCSAGQSLLIEEIGAFSEDAQPLPDYVIADALHVGPGREYASIEAAYAAVPDYGMIAVHPQPGNAAYMSPALLVKRPGIRF